MRSELSILLSKRAGSALLQGSNSHWLSGDDNDALGRGRTAAAGSPVSASSSVSASERRCCSHAKSIHLFTDAHRCQLAMNILRLFHSDTAAAALKILLNVIPN